MDKAQIARPQARSNDLIVVEMTDELLLYDRKSHRAHCLNSAAAQVWKYCDGTRTVSEIASTLSNQFGGAIGEEYVWLAIARFNKARLLEELPLLKDHPIDSHRRMMIGKLGLAMLIGVPLVTSITAPVALAAASCIASGSPCVSATGVECCRGLGCNASGGGFGSCN